MNTIISHKILNSLFFVLFFAVVFSLIGSGQAHALDMTAVPTDIKSGLATFDGTTSDDWSCYLNKDRTGSRFAQSEWPWLYNVNGPSPNTADDGNSSNPLEVSPGQQLTLGISNLSFACHDALIGAPVYLGGNNAADGSANTGINNTYDGLSSSPIIGWTPGDWLATQSKYQFGQPTTLPTDIGSVSSQVGGASTTYLNFNKSTRYWFPDNQNSISDQNSTFGYVAPMTTGEQKTTITVPIYEANYFDKCTSSGCSVVYECVAGAAFITQAQYNHDLSKVCPPENASFSVYLDVQPNPPITISGKILRYNGSSEEALNGVSLNTCTDESPVFTNSSGDYSFTVDAGTGFCIRVANNNIPIGDTAYVIPNGTGPPPSPPIGCKVDILGVTIGYYKSYEWQVAEPGNSASLCDYKLGNNDGYNIVVATTATLSCVVSANPINAPPSSPDTVTATASYGWSQWGFGTPTVSSASGSLTQGAATEQTFPLNATSTPFVYSNTITTPGSGGQYTIKATVVGGRDAKSANCSDKGGLTIDYEPYVRSFGGDVMSGLSSTSIVSCYSKSAGIFSWNSPSSGVNSGDYGAGTTALALATDDINGFASGQDVLNMLNPPPLTFADTSGLHSPEYGGDFSSPPESCSSNNDYYNLLSATSGALQCPSDISGMTLGLNQHYICYSQNNATISGNITYNTAGITSISQLPSFEMVVKGAYIFINTPFNNPGGGVTNLAGTYIAEPNATGSGGTIEDTGQNGVIDMCSASTPDNQNNTCSNDRLVVNGAFIANQINFYRSYGTLSASQKTSTAPDNFDAEEFDFGPINWLIPGNGQPTIQSITSLPPIL